MGDERLALLVAWLYRRGVVIKSICHSCGRRFQLDTGNPATEIPEEEWYQLSGKKVKVFRCGACGALMIVWRDSGRSANAYRILYRGKVGTPEIMKLRAEVQIMERLRNNVLVFPRNKNRYADPAAMRKWRVAA